MRPSAMQQKPHRQLVCVSLIKWNKSSVRHISAGPVSLRITLLQVYVINGKPIGPRPKTSQTPWTSMNYRLFTAVTY